jgi:hypothetical protein
MTRSDLSKEGRPGGHQPEGRLENHIAFEQWLILNPPRHPDKTTSKTKLAGIQTLLQKFMQSGWVV